ncbi:phosphatidate cytidylyltransferase [Pseudoduganella namucuonensis]|uniref:Phosphatidate cytidylyltransferase n=1 Tax=Pseudoduganella namucuonensis TaxID=1035707 RepID=A0A1I7M2I9_9BURK|nr:phosphatidate cytidylyltransferase [Pseudoduganella namucuonensis]SFV16146.1 phosphatidate cytidylyltransferase [Pseudoduganella namucuonensis]
MLKTRIITAVALLAVLLPVLFFNYYPAFAAVVLAFFGAAVWEAFRLFKNQRPLVMAAAFTAAFGYTFLYRELNSSINFWLALAVPIWLLRFTPALKFGLPAIDSAASRMLSYVYAITLVSCFVAIIVLFRHSAVFLLSAMALVWVADIGAYFSGKAFGKRKLAPSISPGKSWEGAIGGGVAVLLLSALTIVLAPGAPWLQDTFAVQLQARKGWALTVALLLLIVAASVVGDLFESMLKRRAGFKDSSKLLPGHGGVLDRIDALVPVLPLAALIGNWL